MASPEKPSTEISILDPDYIALLQSLCVITEPSLNDVTAIFREFRQALGPKKLEPSTKSLTSSSTTYGASKKRSAKPAARASVASDNANGHGCAIAHSAVGFERSCTWQPDKQRCWIMSDVESWNRILMDDCIELREIKWCELALLGYQGPEKQPGDKDVLRASLLTHVLLRQHRCVTYIFLDLARTKIERHVMWHALKTGAMGVKRLQYKQNFIDIIAVMSLTESTICCEAIASMTKITYLSLSSMCFREELVRVIGSYVEQTTSLTSLELLQIEADDANAGLFLDHLTRNKSLKSLHVHEPFLLAREGRALAHVVLHHVTLEKLNVKGSPQHSPCALLSAATVSRSLRELTLRESFIDHVDIEKMATALAIPCQLPEFVAEVMAPPPMSRLRKLAFTKCVPPSSHLQQAYAKLIGGALVELQLSQCGLGEEFVARAVNRLLSDRRLHELNVEINHFSIKAIMSMIEVLRVNKTLKVLVLNMTAEHPQEQVSSLFDMIRQIDAFHRLWLHWVYPRALDFPNCILTAHTPSVSMNLDEYRAEDAAEALGAIVRSGNLDYVSLECSAKTRQPVLKKLADTLASTKSLKSLLLTVVCVPDAVVVDLFRALESNRTIFMMTFNAITFSKRNSKALGRLVERNRAFISLTFDLRHGDSCVDRMVQFRNVYRELKEALRKNRFIINVNVNIGSGDLSKEPAIKYVLGQNTAFFNKAVHFVNGSMDKTDALAFETLQHCHSVPLSIRTFGDISLEEALEKIAEARERLALNYFFLVGVAKANIVCRQNRKAKKKITLLDNIGRAMQARICFYLSLTDVVDI